MAKLENAEIKRIISFLRLQIQDNEQLAEIEDELRSDFGTEFLREPEILKFFSTKILELEIYESVWYLRIISYTRMRMIQRAIKEDTVISLFTNFVRHFIDNQQLISIGGYSIYGRPQKNESALTLRIDIDDVGETENRAHTVTVFIGKGDMTETEEVTLIS